MGNVVGTPSSKPIPLPPHRDIAAVSCGHIHHDLASSPLPKRSPRDQATGWTFRPPLSAVSKQGTLKYVHGSKRTKERSVHYVVRQGISPANSVSKSQLPTIMQTKAHNMLAGKDVDDLFDEQREDTTGLRHSLPEVVDDVYEWGQFLGEGTTAKVYEARCKSRTGSRVNFPFKVAIKCIDRFGISTEDMSILKSEVDTMRLVDHPSCVKLLETFDTFQHIYLVMELMTGGDLFERILEKGSYCEADAAAAVSKIARGLAHLHETGIVHRALKPENLLFSQPGEQGTLKIADVGIAEAMAQFMGPLDVTDVCGTPGYIAPEVARGELYDSAADMWSLGVILYVLLCGAAPFLQEDVEDMDIKLTFKEAVWAEVSKEAQAVVQMLLAFDPEKRISAAALLENQWVEGETAPVEQLPRVIDLISTSKRKWKAAQIATRLGHSIAKKASRS